MCRTNSTEDSNLEELYKLSNLEAFSSKVFANFDPEVQGAAEAYDAAADFATHPEGWLVLMGGYGSGKTHLAAAIANHVVQDHRMQVYFAVAPDLLHHLRAAFAPSSATTYDDRFEQIRSVYLLVVDDLGAEQSTPWAGRTIPDIQSQVHPAAHRGHLQLDSTRKTRASAPSVRPRLSSTSPSLTRLPLRNMTPGSCKGPGPGSSSPALAPRPGSSTPAATGQRG